MLDRLGVLDNSYDRLLTLKDDLGITLRRDYITLANDNGHARMDCTETIADGDND